MKGDLVASAVTQLLNQTLPHPIQKAQHNKEGSSTTISLEPENCDHVMIMGIV